MMKKSNFGLIFLLSKLTVPGVAGVHGIPAQKHAVVAINGEIEQLSRRL